MSPLVKVLAFAALIVLMGCKAKGPYNVVQWDGIADPETMSFSVNGKPVGVGTNGLKSVLSQISQFKENSIVQFRAKGEEWYQMNELYSVDEPLPFQAFRIKDLGDFSNEFYSAMAARNLKIEMAYLEKAKD